MNPSSLHRNRDGSEPTKITISIPCGPDILTNMHGNFGPIEVPASRLLSLPREIRDEIVKHLLRAGNLAILRTSRQLYQESRERLYHEGIFRFKMGFPDADWRGSIPPSEYIRTLDLPDECFQNLFLPGEWIYFQSLHLRIFVGREDKEKNPFFWTRSQLKDLQMLYYDYPDVRYPKQECRVVLDFGATALEPHSNLDIRKMKTVLSMLAPLINFTTVVITFVPGQSELWRIAGAVEGKWDKWQFVKGILERQLGPGKIIRETDDGEEQMVFHPLEYGNSLGRTKQIAET